ERRRPVEPELFEEADAISMQAAGDDQDGECDERARREQVRQRAEPEPGDERREAELEREHAEAERSSFSTHGPVHEVAECRRGRDVRRRGASGSVWYRPTSQ